MEADSISRVAITGATGNVGRHITDALLKTGKHTITAITRPDSSSQYPDAVQTRCIDFNRHETIVEALRDQDALIITLSGRSPFQELEAILVRAAGDAGVRWILPNEWSPDSAHPGIAEDVFLFNMKTETRRLIEQINKSSYISLCTGFRYEYSLSIPKNYDFNIKEKKVRFYDDGATRICTSTWPQIGRAVAALLSLPAKSEGDKQDACLENFRNKVIYVNSFTISQKEMLTSVCRVTETEESDWTITQVPAKEMYEKGMEEMKSGNWMGEGNFLYGRIFFDDGCGDFESSKGTVNDVLGLPKDDLDSATREGLRLQSGSS